MKLKLERPLVFFDLETTGVDPASDRIVEIGLIKVFPSGDREIKERRVNPCRPIPAVATAIHGIHDQDVADEPSFAQIARSLYSWIEGCDLAGYNSNRFDVPMLVEEFLRAGLEVDLSNVKLVDVQNIFHKKEQRTLSAAYRFYCDRDIENAHSALADIEATYQVLLSQVERYDDLEPTVDFLSDYSRMGRAVDFAGRVVLNEKDVEVFNFGKHKGRPVLEVFGCEPSYYDWMMKGDFPLNTKNEITRIKQNAFKFIEL